MEPEPFTRSHSVLGHLSKILKNSLPGSEASLTQGKVCSPSPEEAGGFCSIFTESRSQAV